jgi:hypothetical protein
MRPLLILIALCACLRRPSWQLDGVPPDAHAECSYPDAHDMMTCVAPAIDEVYSCVVTSIRDSRATCARAPGWRRVQ